MSEQADTTATEPTKDTTAAAEARLQTAYTEVELICRRCHARWSPVVANMINFATDPKGREGILRRTIHHAFCPACKEHVDIEHIFSIYDPEQRLVVQVRPAWEFRAGGGEEMYWKRLEQLINDWKDVDVRVDVVFGYDELIEKLLGGQAAVAAAMARAEQEKQAGLKPGDLVEEPQRASTA
jgi:Zn finger protein HypA/HybF involved in hydrogenase expression